MDKEKIRKTLLKLGFKTDSRGDKYFFIEKDLQYRPDSLVYSETYTELTVEIDKEHFSYLNFLDRWEHTKPGSPDKNLTSYREVKYQIPFKTEKSLWWLIKQHGTSKQRRTLMQLQKQENPHRRFFMEWFSPTNSSD